VSTQFDTQQKIHKSQTATNSLSAYRLSALTIYGAATVLGRLANAVRLGPLAAVLSHA